ncbi:UNVERIFIED_CONTAM: hypothetical protein GTU68_054252 [Idotea baltica]|nr:hypothetical protein [Idotea baltica]
MEKLLHSWNRLLVYHPSQMRSLEPILPLL